jgi:type I restriction enzyme R subunit
VLRRLDCVLEPVADRLLKRYAAALEAYRAAESRGDVAAAETATEAMDALSLFKGNIGAYVRLYTFLSQIFDYGTTAIEKRAIFFRRLLPLLDFGRERQGIDLSKLRLTHHSLRYRGQQPIHIDGDPAALTPVTEAGSGSVQQKQKALLAQIIEKLNDLFSGDLTDQDQLIYVNDVLMGKLLESEVLRQQAASNTKEQFGNSPDLMNELVNAIMSALDAHTAMSTQALNSTDVQRGLKDILLNHAGLYEQLRDAASS